MRNRIVILLVALLLPLGLASTAAAEGLDNREATQGIETMRAVYDMRKSDPNVMLAYLRGIATNHENLLKEGVEPDLRMVFIAEAVKFITTDPEPEIAIDHGDTLEEIAKAVDRLDELGVKMEVCAAATRAYGVDNDQVLEPIQPVRSGFIAVMGYQNQGYALVPVY
ncbi:DsrE family protein [Thioalkalivibrio sp. AKL19]|uniref:DsrE family protein n=1 Tax=Thioalkalivibrio sp. AKL19 TaxID=1266914 RepID=UPI00046292D6|nr:DsrE family protein [Thioalkalivibrio sp. AKL19]